jgi:hypothetical protein
MKTSTRWVVRLLGALVLLLAGLALAAAHPRSGGDLIHAAGFEQPARARGGSNQLWYRLAGCEREPYGILATYHLAAPGGGTVRAITRQQLAAMHAAGQARLSIGIFFRSGAGNGTLVDSSSAAAIDQAVANLRDYLADIKAAGFEEILFRFFPVGEINPSDPAFRPPLTGEYWNLIAAVHPALEESGLPFRVDLMVEGAPRDSDPPLPEPWKYPANADWSRAVRDLWQHYVAEYGREHTVGFSFLADADPARLRLRVRHMRYVYEGTYPYLFAADFYGTPTVSEADKFIALHDAMLSEDPDGLLGWRDSGWIIAEGYYDDPLTAAGFASAISATRRTVFYLTQWPWDRANLECGPNPDVNVAPPVDWTAYGGYGF